MHKAQTISTFCLIPERCKHIPASQRISLFSLRQRCKHIDFALYMQHILDYSIRFQFLALAFRKQLPIECTSPNVLMSFERFENNILISVSSNGFTSSPHHCIGTQNPNYIINKYCIWSQILCARPSNTTLDLISMF